MTVKQVALKLGISRPRVYELLRAGKLTFTRLDGYFYIINAESVAEYARTRKSGRPRKET